MLSTIANAFFGTVAAVVLTVVIIGYGFPYLFSPNYQPEGGEWGWLFFNLPFYLLCSWVIAYHTQKIHWLVRLVLVAVGSLLIGWSATIAIAYMTGHL